MNDIDSYFSIPPDEAFELYQTANLLIRRKFEQRLHEIAVDLAPAAPGPATVP